MILVENRGMPDGDKIEVELIKLVSGERLLRLSEARSGLSLEKKLDPKLPVVRQKKQLLGVFEAALARAQFTPA
jgi:hypothetical protein